jgi:hypothetical protein
MTAPRLFINFNDKDDINTKILIDLLRQYQRIIHSCVGPYKSKLKFITRDNNSDDLILTNTSKNLFSCLYRIDHLINTQNESDFAKKLGLVKWKFDLIKSVVENAHFNHFYDSGLLLCTIINEVLILNYENLSDYTSSLLMVFNELIEHMNKDSQNNLISVKLNLNSIKCLKNLLRSYTNSKCLIRQLTGEKLDNFIDLCSKAFIKSFRSEVKPNEKYFSDVLFLFEENLGQHLGHSKLFDGILFEFENHLIENNFDDKFGLLKCVLFDAAFGGDFEHLSNLEYKFDIFNSDEFSSKFIQLKRMINFFDDLIEKFNIKIILSQKV